MTVWTSHYSEGWKEAILLERETDLAGLGHPSPVSAGGQVNADIYQELLKQHVVY
jgi:hypothetical protein